MNQTEPLPPRTFPPSWKDRQVNKQLQYSVISALTGIDASKKEDTKVEWVMLAPVWHQADTEIKGLFSCGLSYGPFGLFQRKFPNDQILDFNIFRKNRPVLCLQKQRRPSLLDEALDLKVPLKNRSSQFLRKRIKPM